MRKILSTLCITVFMGIFIAGCIGESNPVELTPLQIKQIQSRQFEADYKTAYKSVLSVLQDLGYIILSTDYDSGVITAESLVDSESSWWTGDVYTTKHKITASIVETQKFSDIRLNIVKSDQVSNAYGQNRNESSAILDPQIYQNAFAKIENTIFVLK